MYQPMVALNYMGGKSYSSVTGTGRWIASMLPRTPTKGFYAEPFAGMLGVMLQRPPRYSEIASDADKRIIRWWRCLQNEQSREELIELLCWTPAHEDEYLKALGIVAHNTDNEVEHAWAVTVVLQLGYLHCLPHNSHESTINHFRTRRNSGRHKNFETIARSLRVLAKRVGHIQFSSREACKLMSQIKDASNGVIYCDPPYISSEAHQYYNHGFDKPRFVEAMQNAQAQIAISGYGEEWDDLPGQWWRSEHHTAAQMGNARRLNERTEVLWTNYDPALLPSYQPALGGLF